jgi:serine/threonine-protein kinase
MRLDIEACLDGQPVAATAAMGSVGYGGYGDDHATTAMRSADAGATSMLPPMNPDDGGYGYGYDDRPDRRRQRKSNTSTILLVVAAVLVLVGAVLIGKWVSSGGVNNESVPVPNLIGQTQADAQKQLTNSDLKLGTVTQKPCEDQPKGKICDQDPDPTNKVDKNSAVNLVVSTGAPKVALPDVQGLTFDKAKEQLEAKGFVVEKETQESDQRPDVVIGQDPKGDTELEKGATITLTVAVEKAKSTVPDVSNKSCDEAKAQMQQNGLKGDCVEVDTQDQNLVGKVIQTTPQAGAQADKGSTVQIQIGKSSQPQQTQVPGNLQGMSVKDAKKALQDAGLNVGNIAGSQDDDAQVINSDPAPGSTVNRGQTVNLIAFKNGNNNGGNNGGGGFFGGGGG